MTSQPQQSLPAAVRMPKRGYDSFITSPLIKVLVGPENDRSELYIHRNMITSQSIFFANALSDRWENSETKTVNLYDLDPELTAEEVTAYLETVYTKETASQEEENDVSYTCRIYVVAERMLDVQTRNLALQAVYERTHKPFNDGSFYMPGSPCLEIVHGARHPPTTRCDGCWSTFSTPMEVRAT
jgi:hypothetical protein